LEIQIIYQVAARLTLPSPSITLQTQIVNYRTVIPTT